MLVSVYMGSVQYGPPRTLVNGINVYKGVKHDPICVIMITYLEDIALYFPKTIQYVSLALKSWECVLRVS